MLWVSTLLGIPTFYTQTTRDDPRPIRTHRYNFSDFVKVSCVLGMYGDAGIAVLEAGTGIEPVFTDLQSRSSIHEINEVRSEPYQDNRGTGREHDTPAQVEKTAAVIDRSEIQVRIIRAQALAVSIAAAHPDDARQVITAALIDLSAGMPDAAIFGSIREDARWWASMATPPELLAFTEAALEVLPNRAMHRKHRKHLFWRLWGSFSDDERSRFLAFVTGGAGRAH